MKDDGVALIGVGPSMDAVCIVQRCGYDVQSPTEPGETIADGSGYIWIEPISTSKSNIRFYSLAKVHKTVAFIDYNSQVRYFDKRRAHAQAFGDYANRLSDVAKKKVDQEKVASLIAKINDARKKIADTEDRLAKELERRRRAAEAATTLRAFSAVFSLSASIQAAVAMTGEDVKSLANGPITKEALGKIMEDLSRSSGKTINAIQIDQKKYLDSLTRTEAEIIQLGIKYDMDPKGNALLTP